jgi:NTE family protein
VENLAFFPFHCCKSLAAPMIMVMVRRALVLGGGGARGAYEVGVLSYLLAELPRELGRRLHFDVVVGTSSGAINAAFLASAATDPAAAVTALAERWRKLHIAQVYELGMQRLWKAPLALFRGRSSQRAPVALLSAAPLHRMLHSEIDWRGIQKSISEGALSAVAITATEFATSRNVVFVEGNREASDIWLSRNPQVRPVAVKLSARHVLASAAIPLIFPPVEVAGRYYLDGGLAQHSPLRPAIRLGAERILVISLRKSVSFDEAEAIAAERGGLPPTWGQVVGKTMNALLLDRTAQESARVERMNRLLRWGRERVGDDFAHVLREEVREEGGMGYREVQSMAISPSQDLGCMALRYAAPEFLGSVDDGTRRFLRFLSLVGSSEESDALSYLLFEPSFVTSMMELGRADARARRDELVGFFTD